MNPNLVRRIGLVLLVGGLIAAIVLFFTAQPEVKPGLLGVDIRTNRDRMQLERMGGKSYVMLKDFDEWFADLWHGRRLAGSVAVLSVLGFLLCRGLARIEADFAASERAERAQKTKTPGGA